MIGCLMSVREEHSDHGSVTVLTVEVPCISDVGPENRDDFQRLLEEHFAPKRVILDLTQVQSLSSAALGSLLHFWKGMLARQGSVRFCGVSSVLFDVFKTTQLDNLLGVLENESVEEALAKKW